MKTLIKTISVVGLFAISGLTMADQCPDSLSLDELYDCIVVDGAGGTYKPEAAQSDVTETVDQEVADEIDDSEQQQASAPSEDSPI